MNILLWFDKFFYLKAIGAEVQPPPRAGGEASSDDGFRRILTTRESVEAELDVTGFGELCTVFVAGTMSISTVLLWAGDTRISGWVQSISTVLPVDPGAVRKCENSWKHVVNSSCNALEMDWTQMEIKVSPAHRRKVEIEIVPTANACTIHQFEILTIR